MVPFYGWGSTASRLEALQGGSLLLRLSSQKFLILRIPWKITLLDKDQWIGKEIIQI